MKALFVFFILLVLQTVAQAEDLTIVDVRRNITLSDEDPIYKDYYIQGADKNSLKKNLVVFVKRKMTVKDVSSKTIGDFETKVGQLKIIHVEGKIAVAREYKLIERDEEPVLEQIGIMTGDRLDLTDSFVDNSRPKIKPKTAENEVTTEVEATVEINPQDVKIPNIPMDSMPTLRLPADKDSVSKVPTPEI